MTLASFKKAYNKFLSWVIQHWRWLILILASFTAYFLGRKNSKSLRIQAELARDQYKKEADMLDKVHNDKQERLSDADRKYNKALSRLDEKYNDNNSDLKREKDKVYKKLLKEAKKDPEKLDSLLKDMGIEEV